MHIRLASAEDAPSIAAIGQCVWLDTYATEGVRPAMASYVAEVFSTSHMAKTLETRVVYVLEIDHHLVGYGVIADSGAIESQDRHSVAERERIENGRIEIETLYLLPKYQSKGLGKRLLEYILQRYKGVWLTCWEHNTRAIAFYRKNGFIESGESYFELEGERHRNLLFKYSANSMKF